jgi:prepilin-type N-terminal cleavage/methylation domain-containing protein
MPDMAKLRSDRGFTAVELIISLVILGIIMTPLVSSYILGVGTVATSNASTTGTIDAQNLNGFFAGDVASAQAAKISPLCGTGTNVLLLDLGSGASPRYVAYNYSEDSTAEAQQNLHPIYTLSRQTCDSVGISSSNLIVLNDMKTIPSPTCTPNACGSANSTPASISISITEWGRLASDPVYLFTVSGARRVTVSP